MSDAATTTAGIVLAGGRSTRFGSDKLSATYRGEPLLRAPIRVLTALSTQVVIAIGAEAAEPPLLADVDLWLVRDRQPNQGPLAGLVAALAVVEADTVLVAAGDAPEMQRAVLELLIRTLDEDPGIDAVTLQDGPRSRPVPMALRVVPARATAARLFDAGERRLRAVPEALGATVISEDRWTALDPHRLTLLDVDTPEDLPG